MVPLPGFSFFIFYRFPYLSIYIHTYTSSPFFYLFYATPISIFHISTFSSSFYLFYATPISIYPYINLFLFLLLVLCYSYIHIPYINLFLFLLLVLCYSYIHIPYIDIYSFLPLLRFLNFFFFFLYITENPYILAYIYILYHSPFLYYLNTHV